MVQKGQPPANNWKGKYLNKYETVKSLPELAGQVYGFDEVAEADTSSEELFLNAIKEGAAIKDGKYYGEFKRILDYISKEGNPSPENIKVLGVVVTGSPSQLKGLKSMKQVRASSLGAIVEKYE